jgi:outer membrane lipoprotein carrier protein
MRKIIGVLLLLFGPVVYCDSVSETLQVKLNAIRTMTAKFNQVVTANKREVSRSSGVMALSRPGHFRWQTKEPMAQLVVADGHHLWIYDEDLEQVTVKKQDKGLGGTAGLFLSGYNDTLTHDFDVTVVHQKDTSYFDLHAKSTKANFSRLKLVFLGETLNRIELFDQLGQHTLVNLSQIKTNLVLTEPLFKFTPPKGIDVVEQ